jgi:hypothetical protein
MSVSTGQCFVCGDGIVSPGVPGISSDVLFGVCQRCSDRELLEEGGTIYLLRHEPKDGLFPLGTIRVTAAALGALERARQQTWDFLARHVHGDWGEIGRLEETVITEEEVLRGAAATDEDAKLNKVTLHHQRGRLLSIYRTAAGERLWLITELGDVTETVVLTPEEY